MDNDRIVAVAFLTASNLRAIGTNLQRVYPVDATPAFSDLLRALDEAEQEQGECPVRMRSDARY